MTKFLQFCTFLALLPLFLLLFVLVPVHIASEFDGDALPHRSVAWRIECVNLFSSGYVAQVVHVNAAQEMKVEEIVML